jgi:hypothetical protein
LTGSATASPSLVLDVHGTYVIQLKVSDSWAESLDTVTIGYDNIKPIAIAGDSQTALEGTLFSLDGSASSDANFDPLTYRWSIISQPDGADAQLTSADSVVTGLDTAIPGMYIVGLVVNDGTVDSDASNVSVLILTKSEVMIDLLEEVNSVVSSLPASAFKNAKMADKLSLKLLKVIELVEKGKIRKAENMLEKDVLEKVDGCAENSMPDKKDWVVTCEGQNAIFPNLTQVVEMLKSSPLRYSVMDDYNNLEEETEME